VVPRLPRIDVDDFAYRAGQLYCEDVDVDALAAKVGTPFYLYSRATLERHFDRLSAAFGELDPLLCYSIKSCGNVHLVDVLRRRGAGADVVSGGELHRALAAGVEPSKIVFAGVGKTTDELRYALESGVAWINVESEQEFENARRLATELRREARAALRVNPNAYDPKTHDKCATGKVDSKFGVDISRARRFFERYGGDRWLRLAGLHMHIGSPIYTTEPYKLGITRLLALADELAGIGHRIEMIDIGGGYAAFYDGREDKQSWDEYGRDLVPLLRPFVAGGGGVVLEPGRSIVGNAGVLVTRVQYLKAGLTKQFVVVDTGMSHLIRPAMYDAYHFIWPTRPGAGREPRNRTTDPGVAGLERYDVVGPICESSDYLAHDRALPPVARGDLLCIFTAGAYGMAMASQYNSLPRPPEVLVDGARAKIIRRRETYDDLVQLEHDTADVALARTPLDSVATR
jgi:diaminopimelate decarboxylase